MHVYVDCIACFATDAITLFSGGAASVCSCFLPLPEAALPQAHAMSDLAHLLEVLSVCLLMLQFGLQVPLTLIKTQPPQAGTAQ